MKNEYKRTFTPSDLYLGIMRVPPAVSALTYNRKHAVVSSEFLERLQLAVTEVNGCAACSYAHTRMALKQGMSREEITSLLNGDGAIIREEEAKAIMFAQHYADTKGFFDSETYQILEETYGKKEAQIMLSAIKMIQVGNIYGIPLSALLSRLKAHPYRNSTVLYEVGMMLLGVLLLPFALIHGYIRFLLST